MPPSTRLPTHRAALIAAVLMALVFAQTLGLIHRAVHANGAPPQRSALSCPADGQWLKTLFSSHHGNADCQSYDHLTHGDSLPSVAVVVVRPVAPACSVLIHRTWHLAGQSVGFLARGPPPLS